MLMMMYYILINMYKYIEFLIQNKFGEAIFFNEFFYVLTHTER